MVTVGRLRSEDEILRPLHKAAAWRYKLVSSCYQIVIVTATATLVLFVVALGTDAPALRYLIENAWKVSALFVSGTGIGALVVREAHRRHRDFFYQQIIDEVSKMAPSKGKDKAIHDLIAKLVRL
jgi:hypothetical protein